MRPAWACQSSVVLRQSRRRAGNAVGSSHAPRARSPCRCSLADARDHLRAMRATRMLRRGKAHRTMATEAWAEARAALAGVGLRNFHSRARCRCTRPTQRRRRRHILRQAHKKNQEILHHPPHPHRGSPSTEGKVDDVSTSQTIVECGSVLRREMPRVPPSGPPPPRPRYGGGF
jgi:hypothetical protein